MNHAIVSFILKKMSTMITYRKSEIPTHLQQYFQPAEIGLEQTPEQYVAELVAVFGEVRRVLRDDGTCWLNLGDSYGATGGDTHSGFNERYSGTGGDGSKQNMMLDGVKDIKHATGLRPKNLLGIPWRVAFALQADGWYLRQDIIWHKPNPMPESVTDRCTKAHEYIFLLTKSARYWYDAEAVKESFADERMGNPGTYKGNGQVEGWNMDGKITGRNRRSVWTVPTKPYSGAHFAVFPPELIKPCILAGCPDQCCPKCGKGWERQTEYGRVLSTGGSDKGARANNLATCDPNNKNGDANSSYVTGNMVQREKITLGFRPTCTCPEHEPVSGTVLDPFNGSGTTGLVALQTNRKYVGCELNPEYVRLTEKRLEPELAQGRLSL